MEEIAIVAQATWMPSTEYGKVYNRAELPESVFAFPRQRKEPLTDASHVKNALARFDQGAGVGAGTSNLSGQAFSRPNSPRQPPSR